MSLEIPQLNSDQVNLANLRLNSGRPSHPVDALFFHGRSFGDYTGLFEVASDLVKQDYVGQVVLFDNEGQRLGSDIPFQANPGKTWCTEQLLNHGVSTGKIVVAPGGGFHTRWENDDFVRLSNERGWRTGSILTQPHQILRATLGMLKAMQLQRYAMKVYTVTPSQTPWYEVVKGNQGLESKPRVEHIPDELVRVRDYMAKGDLISFPELFRYLLLREWNLLRLGKLEDSSYLINPENLLGTN